MNLLKMIFGGTPPFDEPAKPPKRKKSISEWGLDKAVNVVLNALEGKWNKDLWNPDK